MRTSSPTYSPTTENYPEACSTLMFGTFRIHLVTGCALPARTKEQKERIDGAHLNRRPSAVFESGSVNKNGGEGNCCGVQTRRQTRRRSPFPRLSDCGNDPHGHSCRNFLS